MEEEYLNDEEEMRDFKRRVRQKKRIRGFLIVVNAIVLAYLLYSIGDMVFSFATTYFTEKDGDIILIRNKNEEESKAIYDKYIDKVVVANDYGIYGNYLHLNEHHIENKYFTSFERLVFVKVSDDTEYESKHDMILDGQFLDRGYDLSALSEGDYIVSVYKKNETYKTEEKQKIVKLASSSPIERTIFTLPDQDGIRKKITIKNKITSPCMVVSVKEVTKLDDDYYDLVVIGANDKLDQLQDSALHIKKCDKENGLTCAYKTKASYAIVLDENRETPLQSYYLSPSSNFEADQVLDGNHALSGYDADEYIRELGGSILKAGYCIDDVSHSCEVTPDISLNDFGKMTYRVGDEITLEEIKSILY